MGFPFNFISMPTGRPDIVNSTGIQGEAAKGTIVQGSNFAHRAWQGAGGLDRRWLSIFLVMVSSWACRTINPENREDSLVLSRPAAMIYQLDLSDRLTKPLKSTGWSGELCMLFQAEPGRPDPRRGPNQPLRPIIRVYQQACPFGQNTLNELWQQAPYLTLRASRLIYAGRPELRGEVFSDQGKPIGRVDIDGRQLLSLCSDDFSHQCSLGLNQAGTIELQPAAQVGKNP